MSRSSKSLTTSTSVDYGAWSRDDLIKRIRKLEGRESHKGDLRTSNTTTKRKLFDPSKFNTRFIALKFAYMGWNFNGLSFQYEPTPLPTVEEVILKALEKAKLVTGSDPTLCNLSRCGRTDKGVSALSQVISLNVRSNLSDLEQANRLNDDRELPYIAILNALLPPDIRITGVCLRPPQGFDARFSCLYRHYKYIFVGEGLDINAMAQAAGYFEGEHDFRNFCKIDGSKQITNYRRVIHSSKILPLKDGLFAFDLQGSAFLWHQVRCMVAILFLVGQKHEKPCIVHDLMDIEKYPSRPLYDMAHDIPLVLYDCVFPEMEWLSQASHFGTQQERKAEKEFKKFKGFVQSYQVKSQLVAMMGEAFITRDGPESQEFTNLGDGVGRAFKTYTPINQRPLGESAEQHNAKFLEKKKRKILNSTVT